MPIDHEIPSNNRPLSLLEVLSKVCERFALDQFSSYITQNQRLSPHQNGNRKHHSTETLNIFITDKMLEAMDKKHVTALILLDLSNRPFAASRFVHFRSACRGTEIFLR